MNLTQMLARLSYGPLSNLSWSNDGDGTIVETRLPALVGYINEALLRLYTRFDLLEREVIVLQSSITLYHLSSAFAFTVIGDAHPTLVAHIRDTEESPFTDDLIRVLGAYKTTATDGLPLNDDSDCKSVFTPQHDVLQVPEPIPGESIYVIYQAKHALLQHTDLTTMISLPPVLEEAAIAYAAYKVYFHMNGQENAAKAAEHLGVYESVCAEVVNRDSVNSSVSSVGVKFHDRGFV